MGKPENVALFDLDGTLCDYDRALLEGLEKVRGPEEPMHSPPIRDEAPQYIKNRVGLVTASEDWWANLPRFELGWDVLGVAKKLEYEIMILTQGPRRNPESWSGKKRWIDSNLDPDTNITITRKKSLVYGKVLVDDYPDYILPWLEQRERGLVIMPAHKSNQGFKHPQVIRYNGRNLDEVQDAMRKAKLR